MEGIHSGHLSCCSEVGNTRRPFGVPTIWACVKIGDLPKRTAFQLVSLQTMIKKGTLFGMVLKATKRNATNVEGSDSSFDTTMSYVSRVILMRSPRVPLGPFGCSSPGTRQGGHPQVHKDPPRRRAAAILRAAGAPDAMETVGMEFGDPRICLPRSVNPSYFLGGVGMRISTK